MPTSMSQTHFNFLPWVQKSPDKYSAQGKTANICVCHFLLFVLQDQVVHITFPSQPKYPTKCCWGSIKPTVNPGHLLPHNSCWHWKENSDKNSISRLQKGQNFLLPWTWQKHKWKFGFRTAELNPRDYKRQNWKSSGWLQSPCCLPQLFLWAFPWVQLCSTPVPSFHRIPRLLQWRWATVSLTVHLLPQEW